MNKHLKAAATRYTIKDALINPISDIDAEIIAELIIITKMVVINSIQSIIKGYRQYVSWKRVDYIRISPISRNE